MYHLKGTTWTTLVDYKITSNNYTLALKESNGFFTDIDISRWVRMKERQRGSRNCQNKCENSQARVWYQNNFDPTFTCEHEAIIGGLGDAAKWVCDPHRISKDNCLVYSVGSNNQFQFEEEVLRKISETCEIHTFDHTVGEKPSNLPNKVHFHPWGLGAETKVNPKGFHLKRMKDIMELLGHQNRSIDIFKIDCEGCEWNTYKD